MPGARIKGQTTRVRSFSAFVRAANPDFDLERRREPAWEFESGRHKKIFYQNIAKFGPYTPKLPISTAAPELSGDPQVGATLSCSSGEWRGAAPFTYTYEWLRNDVLLLVADDTASSYTLVEEDYGAIIHCVVTARNVAGTGSAASNDVGPIYQPAPVNLDAPDISGITTVGQTLAVTDGVWDGDPDSYAYQWVRAGQLPPVNVAIPVISGTARTGQTLTVSTGVWDGDPAEYTYQWIREDAPPPANTAVPAITGSPNVGQALTTTTGTWTGAPTDHDYQWKREP